MSDASGAPPRNDAPGPLGTGSHGMVRSNSGFEGDEDGDGVSHPVEPRSRIPILPPVLVSFKADNPTSKCDEPELLWLTP